MLSPVPNMDIPQAVEWFRTALGVSITERFIRESITRGDLACSIIAGKRTLSSQSCFEFIVTRPNRKNSRKRDAS